MHPSLLHVCFVSALIAHMVSGSASLDLFPSGEVPGEHIGAFGPEACVGGTSGTDFGGGNDSTCMNVSVPALEPFLLRGSDTAVIIAPGGGYASLSWDREGTDAARWLNSIGVSAFVLKYRVPARSWLAYGEAPLMDAQRAVRFLRSSALKFGLNGSRIGFMGFSAGGHLAAHLSTNFASPSYPHIDYIDDQSCKPDFTFLVYPGFSRQSLAANVTKDHPAAFIMQAENDPFGAQNALYYYLQLKAKNAPASEVHIYQTGGHAYGLCSVRDAKGNVAALIASNSTSGPPVHPAFVPWTEVCTWPQRAERFLVSLGLIQGRHVSSSAIVV